MTEQGLRAKADRLEAAAKALRVKANGLRQNALERQPLAERLVYAATARCECGAGLAYDPAGKARSDKNSPFVGPAQWECSNILRFVDLSADQQASVKAAVHSGALPFSCYEVKSERQPSANGLTTRPQD